MRSRRQTSAMMLSWPWTLAITAVVATLTIVHATVAPRPALAAVILGIILLGPLAGRPLAARGLTAPRPALVRRRRHEAVAAITLGAIGLAAWAVLDGPIVEDLFVPAALWWGVGHGPRLFARTRPAV